MISALVLALIASAPPPSPSPSPQATGTSCPIPFADASATAATAPSIPADVGVPRGPALTVVIAVDIGADGRVLGAKVTASSGVPELDAAALAAAKAATYRPKIVFCKPVRATYDFRADFEPEQG